MRLLTGRACGLIGLVCLLTGSPAYAEPIQGGAGDGTVASALAGLNDVTLTSPATGSVLIKSAGNWVDGQLDLADPDAITGILPDANIPAAIMRDAEAAAGYQPLDLDLADLADGILTFFKVGGATANRCARFNASGNLVADSVDCGASGFTGTTSSTITIDSDAVGPEPVNGAGWIIKGGTGDLSWLWDAAGNIFRLTGPAGTTVEFPDPGDGSRRTEMVDNIAEPIAPASGRTILYSLGGELYKKDNADSTSERLLLNSGNVSGDFTCNASGVCTSSDGAIAIDELSDVTITSPALAQVVVRGAGGQWVNAALDLGAGASVSGVLSVARGGTGIGSGTSGGVLAYTTSGTLASSSALTAGGLVVGGGAGAAPSSLAVQTNGQIPIGDGSGAPTLATIAGTAGRVTVTNGAGTINLTVPDNPSLGGTVTAQTGFAVTSGCTLDTDIDCPASSSSGGAITLREDSDLGSSTWRIDLGATNLSTDFSLTPGTDGKLSGASLLTNNTVGFSQLAVGAAPFVWWQDRVSATATATTCLNLANGVSTGAGSGTCNSANTAMYALFDMRITGFGLFIRVGATTPATTNGCDIGIAINGMTQGSDTDFLDWGAAALDAATERQYAAVSYNVTAGDRVEAVLIDAGASQCPSGSGCSCGGTIDGVLTVMGALR